MTDEDFIKALREMSWGFAIHGRISPSIEEVRDELQTRMHPMFDHERKNVLRVADRMYEYLLKWLEINGGIAARIIAFSYEIEAFA